MADTIELLEVIGQDASLRHASAEELAKLLEQAQASEALTAAVVSGNRSPLSEELGHKQYEPPQSGQTGHEEEQPEDDEPLDVPAPDTGKSP